MADVPTGAEILTNPRGQAPSLRTTIDGTVVYAVPGVPAEMRAIVTESILPDLLRRAGGAADVRTTTLRIAVRGESEVASLVAHGEPTPPGLRVAYLASPGDVRLRVSGPGALVESYARLRGVLGDLVYAEDETLDVAVHRLLAERGATVSVAESLTGGQLGQALTAMPGSSATFVGGMVAYAAGLKTSLLEVDAGLLDREGPVHPGSRSRWPRACARDSGPRTGWPPLAWPDRSRRTGTPRVRSMPRWPVRTAMTCAHCGSVERGTSSVPSPSCTPRPAPVGPDRGEQPVLITCLQWSVDRAVRRPPVSEGAGTVEVTSGRWMREGSAR